MKQDGNHDLGVVGIGNALVDVLHHVDERFLERHGVTKGIMQLVDLDRANELYRWMGSASRASGGSTANTIAGLALLGNSAGYIGKVKDDELGEVFKRDTESLGARYRTRFSSADSEFATGRSMILITPDGERSMNTYLGASERLSVEDIDADMIDRASWIYLEGYRLDGKKSQEAFRVAVDRCHASGGKVAVTLSDPFCVERNRAEFRSLIDDGVELLFGNLTEILSLYETDSIDDALDAASSEIEIVACTMSERGVTVGSGSRRIRVEAYPTRIVDATGAGDLFASGMFHGLISGSDLETAARMGCLAASEVIGHIGARPVADLRQLFRDHGLGS